MGGEVGDGIGIEPWSIGMALLFRAAVGRCADVFDLAGFFAAGLFFGVAFLAGGLFEEGLAGIGMCMPGIFICATAGAGNETKAAPVAATNREALTAKPMPPVPWYGVKRSDFAIAVA